MADESVVTAVTTSPAISPFVWRSRHVGDLRTDVLGIDPDGIGQG